MKLHQLLARRADGVGPVKVGVIGAGKFASMFLTQALHPTSTWSASPTSTCRRRGAPDRTGWPDERYAAASLDEAASPAAPAVLD